jgi:hypothetical protein
VLNRSDADFDADSESEIRHSVQKLFKMKVLSRYGDTLKSMQNTLARIAYFEQSFI